MSAAGKRPQEKLRERITSLSPAERLELALRLSEQDVQAYAETRAADRHAALEALRPVRRRAKRTRKP
jgi:hypothetical protein